MKKRVGILFLFVIFLGVILLSENVSGTVVVCGNPSYNPGDGSFNPGMCKIPTTNAICPSFGSPVNSYYENKWQPGYGDPAAPVCGGDGALEYCNVTNSCATNHCSDSLFGLEGATGAYCLGNTTTSIGADCMYNVNSTGGKQWFWYQRGDPLIKPENQVPAGCSDGFDNDCDKIGVGGCYDDLSHNSINPDYKCGAPETNCNDGLDNNCGNGADCNDPSCAAAPNCFIPSYPPESACGDGIDNDNNGQWDWDTQVWNNGYPNGSIKSTKGDVNCEVDLNNITSSANILENSNMIVLCNTSVENPWGFSDRGINSVGAYVGNSSNWVACTLDTFMAWADTKMVFNCPAGSIGTKTLKCEVNTSRSYSNNPVITKDIVVQSSSQPGSCQPVDNCKGYTTPTACQNDCNNAWLNGPTDGLNCNVCSGSTYTSCGCAWNGSSCDFAYSAPQACGTCGNGLIEAQNSEECDGTNITVTCSDVGATCGGSGISCTSSCKLDASACTGCGPGTCGDGAKNDQELCDGNNLGGKTCASFNLQTGILGCFSSTQSNSCHFDTSRCVNITGTGWCSIGNENITKECDVEPIGYRNYQWTGTWHGTINATQQSQCQDNPFSKLVLCPSQFRLPFFQGYSFVIAGAAIALAYYFLIRKKKIVFV